MARTKKSNLKLVDKDEDNNNVKPGANDKSRELASFWKEQIEFVEQANKSWHKKGNDIIKRFRDERTKADESTLRRLNILWATIKTLKPALYGKKPIPVIERRFLQRDPVGRISATMLERAVRNQLDDSDLHQALNRAVLDYLLPGRGVVWVRYEPEFGEGDSLPVTTESGVEDELNKIDSENEDSDSDDKEDSLQSNNNSDNKLETTGEQLLSEQTPVDYIDWHDFLIFPARARTWNEVQAIGKWVFVSKKEAKQRFGKKIGSEMKGDVSPVGSNRNKQSYVDNPLFRDINQRNIKVCEIWNKTDRKIYWVSPGYDYLADIKKDFLKLKKFFPVPEPISSTLTNENLIPVPDYYEYQDQAIQIDELTQRLALLTKACKVAGTYDASNAPLKRLMTEGVENELLPVDAWAVHAEKGGVKGGISFLPIDEIQKVIQTLQEVRQQLMQDLDLITGVSDIIRGTTDSRETLGGIRLKNNNAGTRLSERQNEVARFARDTIAIMAEIIAKHFDDKTLIEASGILFDDEMAPESIIDELTPQQPSQGGQSPFGNMGKQQGQQGSPQGGLPALPMGNGMQGNAGMPPPQGGIPGASPGLPAPPMGGAPGTNIIPFPGGQSPDNIQGQGLMPPQQPANLLDLQAVEPQIDVVEIVIQKIMKAIELLRKDVPRGYRIEIETDSTIFGDAAQERQDAVEFITAVMQFLTQASTVAQELPEITPLLGRFLQFGVRKFRVGRDLESSIDQFVRQMDKKSKEAVKNPKPNPEEQKAQMDIQGKQMDIQAQERKHQLEHQSQQANDQRDTQKAHMEDQRQGQLNQMEMSLKQQEHQLKIREMELKHQIAMAELGAKSQQMQQEAQISQQQGQQKMQQSQMEMSQDQQQHKQTVELSEKEHSQNLQQTELQNKQAKEQHTQKMGEMKLQATEKDKARKDKAKQPKGKA